MSEALRRLGAVYHQQPTFGWPLRTFGHAVLTCGLVLLLQPTPEGIAAAFALGLLIGMLKLVRLPTVALLAFGIVAAGTLVRASPADFVDHQVAGLGAWAAPRP